MDSYLVLCASFMHCDTWKPGLSRYTMVASGAYAPVLYLLKLSKRMISFTAWPSSKFDTSNILNRFSMKLTLEMPFLCSQYSHVVTLVERSLKALTSVMLLSTTTEIDAKILK
jgi:hypothetical protein